MRDIAVGNITLGYLVQHARDVPHVSSAVSSLCAFDVTSSMQMVSSSARVLARRLCQLGALGSECADVWGNEVKAAQSLTQKSVGLRRSARFHGHRAHGDGDRRCGPKRTVGFIGGRSAKHTHTGP